MDDDKYLQPFLNSMEVTLFNPQLLGGSSLSNKEGTHFKTTFNFPIIDGNENEEEVKRFIDRNFDMIEDRLGYSDRINGKSFDIDKEKIEIVYHQKEKIIQVTLVGEFKEEPIADNTEFRNIESIEQLLRIKQGFVAHVPGHKNSKGETAPWVVKQHKTGKIISSHKTEQEAKNHLRDIEIHK